MNTETEAAQQIEDGIDAAVEEFAMSKYASSAARELGLLAEIARLRLLNAPSKPVAVVQPVAATDTGGEAAGIEAAARWVESRRNAYMDEHGSYDPETGGTDLPASGAEYVGELDEIIEGLRAIKPPSPVVDDLKTLVIRLAYSLRKAAPDNDLPAQALDYVRRKGLYTSPLRTDAIPEGCTPAEVQALRVDAERYRWLRDRNSQMYDHPAGIFTATRITNPDGSFSHNDLLADAELDAAVDAARTAQQGDER